MKSEVPFGRRGVSTSGTAEFDVHRLSLFFSVLSRCLRDSVVNNLSAARLTANPFTQIHPFVSHERRDGDDCRLFPASLDCTGRFCHVRRKRRVLKMQRKLTWKNAARVVLKR